MPAAPHGYGRAMPRKPRSLVIDGLCHVTARGNRRARIFSTPLAYFEFLLALGDALEDSPVCHGFCLMPNHLHLVLDGEQPPL